MAYPIMHESSSVVPRALKITSSFGLLSPVNVPEVPAQRILTLHTFVNLSHTCE